MITHRYACLAAVLRRLTPILLIGLAACGTVPSAPGSTTGGEATTGAPTGASIRFQFFGDVEERAIYERIAKEYQAANPGRAVEIVNVPSQGDHMTRLAAAFTAGDPPEVFLVNYRRYGQFVKNGVLEPVGPLMAQAGMKESDYYEQALSAFRSNGVLQCVPQNIASLVVYYNRNLFEQHQVALPRPGWTWQDFLAAARQLTVDANNDGQAEVHGVGVEPEMIRLAPFIWQNGGELVDNQERPARFTIDDAKAMAAIRYFLDLRTRFGVVPSEAEVKAEDLETRFRAGKLAMLLSSRRVVPSLRKISEFTWDVAPLPVGEKAASVLHSDAYCIARGAKDKAAAWEFVRFAAGPAGQKIAAELGRTVPSLKSIAESPAFLEPSRPPASSKVFLDVLPNVRALPVVSTWPEIESSFNQEFEVAFYANDEANEAPGAGGEREREIPGNIRRIAPAASTLIDASLERALKSANEALQKASAP